MKKIAFIASTSIVFSLVALSASIVSAQNISSPVSAAPAVHPCPSGLAKGVSRGLRGAAVLALQEELLTLGYFNGSATGYFGPITFGALVSYQRSQGLPGTGYFGPLTYAAIMKNCLTPTSGPSANASLSADPSAGPAPLQVSFIGAGVTGGSQYIIEFGDGANSGPILASSVACDGTDLNGNCGGQGTLNSSHIYSQNGSYTAMLESYIACMWSNPRCMIATIPLAKASITVGSLQPAPFSIRAVIPTNGPVGSTITLTRSGLNAPGLVLRFAEGSVPFVSSSDGTSITFVVPPSIGPYCQSGMMCAQYLRQITPSEYKVYLQNADGSMMSNSLSFTVTAANGGPLSITGLDAPTTLALGTPGTWTVHVSTLGSNLHYGVVWGDEPVTNGASIMAPPPTTVQTSATFTHAYQHSGTFSPTFTVTDDSGRSLSTSATVTITPLY